MADMLKRKRGSLGLRDVAKEITHNFGVISPSTLSRIEQGNAPDIDTYITLCQWLNVSPNFFTSDKTEEQITTRKIVAHLRADKNLSPETSEALVTMITLAYESLKTLPPKNVKKK